MDRELRVLKHSLFPVRRKRRKDPVLDELFAAANAQSAAADTSRNFVDREDEEVDESAGTAAAHDGAARRRTAAELGGSAAGRRRRGEASLEERVSPVAARRR